jgi:sterol-4alpha-carboxylate 3-dehydrogenase (decarboxylating)
VLTSSNVTFYIGDISKLEDVSNAVVKVSVRDALGLRHGLVHTNIQSGAQVVIHTASPTHGLGAAIYELVNVTGTKNVIKACQDARVPKLVYTSSAGVIYSGKENLIDADERLVYPKVALDAYNDTKARAEELVLASNGESGVLTCALRPSGIFGPGDRQAISGFHSVIKNGQTKFQIGSNQNLFDWTYVGNVAHAHLLAADKLDTLYPIASLHEPLPEVNLSLGEYRIPTSAAHPLGPKVNPTADELAIAAKFESDAIDPTDLRPVLRSRMDQFSALADDEGQGQAVAGQAFFINNCEPVNFWDWTRAVWRKLGHTPPYTIVLPVMLGMVLATLAELFSKLTGREPGFTRFRVSFATQQRYYDSERARRLLGYTPLVGITEGLDRWTEWYAQELNKMAESAAETPKTK